MVYLLDTNTAIFAIKKYPSVVSKLQTLSPEDVALSAMTVGEMYFGACKSNWPEETKAQLTQFLKPWTIYSFDKKSSLTYGEIRHHLEKYGTPIGERDMIIASIGLRRKLIVVTKNIKEFERVPGLSIEDWLE